MSLFIHLMCRLLELVEEVLNFVEVTPKHPFEFAAPDFGVRVEDPPAELQEEESFTPNITDLFSLIWNSTAASIQTEEIPELPSAMVSLASSVLHTNDSESRPQIVVSIYGRDALFQQRQNFTRRIDRESERVGSIVCEISLRQNGKLKTVSSSPNSNVVRPSFMKSRVSMTEYGVNRMLAVLV